MRRIAPDQFHFTYPYSRRYNLPAIIAEANARLAIGWTRSKAFRIAWRWALAERRITEPFTADLMAGRAKLEQDR